MCVPGCINDLGGLFPLIDFTVLSSFVQVLGVLKHDIVLQWQIFWSASWRVHFDSLVQALLIDDFPSHLHANYLLTRVFVGEAISQRWSLSLIGQAV